MQKLTILYVVYYLNWHVNALTSNALSFYFLQNLKQGVNQSLLNRLIPVLGENKVECLTFYK